MEELGLTELSKVIKEKEAPSLGDWIKLNVGGAMFETSRATLTRVPDSLLGRMFDPDSSLPPARKQDGAFLIDSCPSSFPVILHWLRYREVALGEVTVETALSAANYFGLQGLVVVLEEMAIKKELKIDSDWNLTLHKICYYAALFDKLGPQDGLLSEEQVGRYLMQYPLPDSTLDKIWEFFEQDKDSFLDRYEFTVVVHLADVAERFGKEIPNQVVLTLRFHNTNNTFHCSFPLNCHENTSPPSRARTRNMNQELQLIY